MAYKTGWLKKVINGVSTKIFSFAHVKTVYTDYENGKLLSDKLTEIDDDIAEINSNLSQLETSDIAGGKNLFNINTDTLVGTVIGNEWTFPSSTSKAINIDFEIGQYAISGYCKNPNSTTRTRLRCVYTDNSSESVFYTESTDYVPFSFVSSKDKTIDYLSVYYGNSGSCTIKDLQIEKNSTSTPYEPYISSVKMLADEVSAQNESLAYNASKNMLYANVGTINGVTITSKDKSTALLNGTNTSNVSVFETADVIPSGEYHIKVSNGVGALYVWDLTHSKTIIEVGNTECNFTLTEPSKLVVGFSIGSGHSFTNFEVSGQLEKGTIATDFVPYNGKSNLELTNDVVSLKNDLSESKSKLDNISIDTIDRKLGEITFKGIGFSAKLTLLKIGNQLELLRGQIHTVGNFFSVTSKDELSFDLSVSEFGDYIKELKMASKLAFSGQGIFASKVIGMIYFREYTSSGGDKGIKVTLSFNDSYEFSSANVRSGMVQFDF